jgi:hypothetical protein
LASPRERFFKMKVKVPKEKFVVNDTLGFSVHENGRYVGYAEYYLNKDEWIEKPKIENDESGQPFCRFVGVWSPYSNRDKLFQEMGYDITGYIPNTGFCMLLLSERK